jgi:hypothetical protein
MSKSVSCMAIRELGGIKKCFTRAGDLVAQMMQMLKEDEAMMGQA